MLLYLHGFNSSPASFKARLLKQHLEALGRGGELEVPALPPDPARAARLIDGLARQHPHAVVIGSSLGGYYATWLAERHGLRAVLVNPAVRPYELLAPLIGRQRNPYTGTVYELTEKHLTALSGLEVARVTPERYLLMVCTADEVLDHRHALVRYRGCRRLVVEGGDHAFSDFGRHLAEVLAFCDARTG